MSFLSFLSETFLRTRIDQGESLTILRRTYQTATSRNRLWRSTIPDLSTAISQPLWCPFKQPNRVSAGVSIRPVQSDKETIDNTGSRPTRIVSYTDRSWLPADRSPHLSIDRHTAPIDRQTARKPPHERFLRNFGCNFLLFSLLSV